MKNTSFTAIGISFGLTLLLSLYCLVFDVNVGYAPYSNEAFIHLAILLGYQVALLSFVLVGRKTISSAILIASPIIAFLAYYFQVFNTLTHVLNAFYGSHWDGIDAQSMAFDKDQLIVIPTALSILTLTYYYITPSEKSWDRTLMLVVNIVTVTGIIVYHLGAYFTVYKPIRDRYVEQLTALSISDDTSWSSDCTKLIDSRCFTFKEGDAFPVSAHFDGVAPIHELSLRYANGEAITSESVNVLKYFSVTDTYRDMFMFYGFVKKSGDTYTLLYSNTLITVAIAIAESLAMQSCFIMITWLYGGLLLGVFHSRFVRD